MQTDKFIENKSIILRDVEVDDAEFILSLRCDSNKAKFLNKTENNIEQQKEYIKKYKAKNNEWYFIIENKEHEPLGTVRIYDVINNNDFCWGSWIIKDGAPVATGIASAVLIYEYAFYKLNFTKVHFDVRKENRSVRNFHERFGAECIKENKLDSFYIYSKEKYEKIRNRYIKYIPE